jgi:hypothetical protein
MLTYADVCLHMQVGTQRCSTSSLRYQRAAGAEPTWNQTFAFYDVQYESGDAAPGPVPGAAPAPVTGAVTGADPAPVTGAGPAQQGLQIIVCEVDTEGGLDYVVGHASVPLSTLLRARRLVGDVPLSRLSPTLAPASDEATGEKKMQGAWRGGSGARYALYSLY